MYCYNGVTWMDTWTNPHDSHIRRHTSKHQLSAVVHLDQLGYKHVRVVFDNECVRQCAVAAVRETRFMCHISTAALLYAFDISPGKTCVPIYKLSLGVANGADGNCGT